MSEKVNAAKIFGEKVFNDEVMRERLPKKIYKELHKTIDEGKELDPVTAEGRCGGDEGLGCGDGSNPLYPLVSASDRFYGGKT